MYMNNIKLECGGGGGVDRIYYLMSSPPTTQRIYGGILLHTRVMMRIGVDGNTQ